MEAFDAIASAHGDVQRRDVSKATQHASAWRRCAETLGRGAHAAAAIAQLARVALMDERPEDAERISGAALAAFAALAPVGVPREGDLDVLKERARAHLTRGRALHPHVDDGDALFATACADARRAYDAAHALAHERGDKAMMALVDAERRELDDAERLRAARAAESDPAELDAAPPEAAGALDETVACALFSSFVCSFFCCSYSFLCSSILLFAVHIDLEEAENDDLLDMGFVHAIVEPSAVPPGRAPGRAAALALSAAAAAAPFALGDAGARAPDAALDVAPRYEPFNHPASIGDDFASAPPRKYFFYRGYVPGQGKRRRRRRARRAPAAKPAAAERVRQRATLPSGAAAEPRTRSGRR